MDIQILNFINEYITNKYIINFFQLITFLGDLGLIWLLFAVYFYRRNKYYSLIIIVSLLVSSLITDGIIKHLVERPRPFVTYPYLVCRIAPPSTLSFPSGHAATSMACATAIYLLDKKIGKLAYFIAIMIAISRNILLVHYPSDVLVGSVIGIFSGILVVYYINKKR